MKFRDAIRKVTVHDIISRTLQMEKQPYCYDVDHQSSQYQIHIFIKTNIKRFMISKSRVEQISLLALF